MPVSSSPLEELIPHRPPMVLIDEIVAYDLDARTLTAAIDVREEWKGNWVSIEYMAQAAAALVGLFDRRDQAGHPARPGFLLGTRRLTLDFDEFEVGKRYFVDVRNEFSDDEAASFACTIRDGEKVLAAAMLNAYRPQEIESFLSARR